MSFNKLFNMGDSKDKKKEEDHDKPIKNVISGKIVIRSKGECNVKELYSQTHQYLQDADYKSEEDGSEYFEKFYFQEDTEFGKTIKYKWVAKKDDRGYSPQITLEAEIRDLVDVEKVENNKKVKYNKGDIKISISASVFEKPINPKASHLWINKFFFNVKKASSEGSHSKFKAGYEQDIYDEVEGNTIKEFFGLDKLIRQLLKITV